MTAGGALFMAVSWATIIGFNVFCLRSFLAGSRRGLATESGDRRS